MPTRRSVLASATITCLAGASGCLGGFGRPEKLPGADRFEFGCPPQGLPTEREFARTVCSHTVDPRRTDIYVAPSTAVTSEPRSLELTVYNHTGRTILFNPYDWTLWKQKGGSWTRLERYGHADGGIWLDPGETTSRRLGDIVVYFTDPPGEEGGRFEFDTSVYLAGISTPTPPQPEDKDRYQRNIAVFEVD